MSLPGAPNPVYVQARRVLLDALEALRVHSRAVLLVGAQAIYLHGDITLREFVVRMRVLLVGAQAIYLHTGEGDLAVAPYTSDADLVLDPGLLADDPKLEALMRRAGFVPASGPGRVGTWVGPHGVPIDLMVPEALSGPGRRAARLGVHGDHVARKARGLEAALVDNVVMTIGALEPGDAQRFEVGVAGPSALLVAKLHKINDRSGSPTRKDDKDALDVYRLLGAIPTETFAVGISRLLADELSAQVTAEALGHLETLFGSAEAEGSQMAARAVEGLEDPAAIAAACAALADDLLTSVRR